MGAIGRHTIVAEGREWSLLEWLRDHRGRHYASFKEPEQLDRAKQIARIEDQEARELLLCLLGEATLLQDGLVEMHRGMETLYEALREIEQADQAAEAAGEENE